jgi:hypothetical protein
MFEISSVHLAKRFMGQRRFQISYGRGKFLPPHSVSFLYSPLLLTLAELALLFKRCRRRAALEIILQLCSAGAVRVRHWDEEEESYGEGDVYLLT